MLAPGTYAYHTTLQYSSNSKQTLVIYQNYLKGLFKNFNLKFVLINLPTKSKLKTFLKSPHVNKRSKENFQLTVYKFKIHACLNFFTIKLFRFNVPKNIHLKVLYSS